MRFMPCCAYRNIYRNSLLRLSRQPELTELLPVLPDELFPAAVVDCLHVFKRYAFVALRIRLLAHKEKDVYGRNFLSSVFQRPPVFRARELYSGEQPSVR